MAKRVDVEKAGQAPHVLKNAQRQAIASAQLTDAEMALIDSAEIPAEHRYSVDKP